MEVVTRLLPKLAELVVGEYNLQKEVKGGIKFLQVELEHMKAALEKISNTPTDQLDKQDKIWARDVRELSYDIEDKVDTFIVRCKCSKPDKQHGFKKIIDRSLDLLMQPKIRRKIATDIRDIKSRVEEVCKRRDRYKIDSITANPVSATIDPRLLGQYKMATELVGIDEARDELIKMMVERDDVSIQQAKIISIVGFGGLGKTTLAKAVYDKISAQFECRAFVSVSQTTDMKKVLKGILYDLGGNINDEMCDELRLIDEFRKLLHDKRYFIVVDDIWDIPVWEIIRCALPHNKCGYQIIATTRIVKVAERAGCVYNMKPLSIYSSRILLYRRIFGIQATEKCPDKELSAVSDKILRKCAGVPLAIITISSLLANKGRNKMEWYEVCNSIGTGMENSLDAQNMRKILSYSYYDMPSHLRTCLLYLSVFPEDYEIEKDRLIWLWIAEGFIWRDNQRKSIFGIGEDYFNDLISRSMIQPVYNEFGIDIQYCRVHDMLLDLICSLSNEENFVTILSNMDPTSASTTIRRLSLQDGKVDLVSTRDTNSVSQVRSVAVFSYTMDQMPSLQSFNVLRVLDLEGCDLSQGYCLKYLGGLLHLRYLNLRHTRIRQFPEDVDNLQFLEILDVRGTKISHLPLSVAQQKHLLCISVTWHTRVQNGIGSLRLLEKLSWLRIDDGSINHIEQLGLLIELRVLDIVLFTDKWKDKLVESISKLPKIQSLRIIDSTGGERDTVGLDSWAPRHLRQLQTTSVWWFSRLPAWMNNPSHMQYLRWLHIAMRELQQEHLGILGSLPALNSLGLTVDHRDLGIIRRFVVGAGSFPCLVHCMLEGFVGPVVFQQGAMPTLTRLDFEFHVRGAREIEGGDGGFDLGLANLPSLQDLIILLRFGGASEEEVGKAIVEVCKAIEIHPNEPTLKIGNYRT